MNLILHQIKMDVRHFRWLLVVLWVFYLAHAILMHSLTVDWALVAQICLYIAETAMIIMLSAIVIQADPLTGTTAGWLTRPIRPQHLFWAKSAFIVVFLLLPRLAANGVVWALRGYSGDLWLKSVGELLMVSAAFASVAAALASFCQSLPRFFLLTGIAVAVFCGWEAGVSMLKVSGAIRDVQHPFTASYDSSLVTAGFLLVDVAALAAWIAQARLRRLGGGVAFLAVGLLGLPLFTLKWPFDFLRPRVNLTHNISVAAVTEKDRRQKMPDAQYVFADFVAKGVPERDIAVVQQLGATIRFDDRQGSSMVAVRPDIDGRHPQNGERLWPAVSQQGHNYLQMIQNDFPADTFWFNDDNRYYYGGRAFTRADEKFNGQSPPGTLSGQATLDLFTVKKVAEVALKPQTFNTFSGQTMTIEAVEIVGNSIQIAAAEATVNALWDRDMQTAGFRARQSWEENAVCSYVLYHADSGEAFIAQPEVAGERMPDALIDSSVIFFHLRFPYSPIRERLTGKTAAEWVREARLRVYAPIYDGTARVRFTADLYQWKSPTNSIK